MIFFGDEQNKSLSEGIASHLKTDPIYPDVVVFSDGERRVALTEKVLSQDVVFLKTASITPNIDSQVIETAFLIDAMKRNGAKSITGIMPHFPYGRGDHLFGDGESVPLEVVIHTYESAGLTKIIFVDPHTIRMGDMFKVQVEHVSALPVLALKIKELGFNPSDSVLVSPDMGGLRRVKALSEYLDNAPFISLEKERDHETGKVQVEGLDERVAPNCYVIDDEIASGGTIITALNELEKQGAEKVYVLATHAVFSGKAPEVLQNSKASKVIVTDSIPVPVAKQFEKLEILGLGSLISEKI